MNIVQFKKVAVVETFNTNNGWGFGGSSGKKYSYKGFILSEGKWSYRHAPSESFTTFNSSSNSLTRKEFEELISNLE